MHYLRKPNIQKEFISAVEEQVSDPSPFLLGRFHFYSGTRRLGHLLLFWICGSLLHKE